MARPQAGLAVVQSLALVEGDEDVVIDPSRIVIGRIPVAVGHVAQAPGSGAEKLLARHAREGAHHTVVPQMAGHAKIFGEPASRLRSIVPAAFRHSFRTSIWIGPSARPWTN